MLGIGARTVWIWVYRIPVEMRKQYDELAALVARELRADIRTGDVYVIARKPRKRAKALMWDGTGIVCLRRNLCNVTFRRCGIAPQTRLQ